ncbi:heterokaryon incompatibility protein-domain-containing protein [Neurospora tetraspora]|uniref:Heterokaryon incompatibility protein-domain-containing protein n=1 Tax=Neurospora tetraspora TaxID=94610 RepID=A0AAE0JJT9_9PEZI|nr:heterokaryon incompatibility protein-domain-containing protein [Neurospora tetraspora]
MGGKITRARHVCDGEGRLSTACWRFVAKIPFLPVKNKEKKEGSVDLCQRCKELDLDGIFNGPCPSTDSEMVLFLGTLDKESPCALCRFFYSMRRPSLTGETTDLYHLRKYSLGHLLDSSEFPGATWAVDYGWGSDNWVAGRDYHLLSRTMVDSSRPLFLPQSPSSDYFAQMKAGPYPQPTLKGLPVNETSVNYPLLRGWIKECGNHRNCSYTIGSHHLHGPPIRAIDCTTRFIVNLRPGDRYIALSYVWGNKPLLENKGSRFLPANAPKVIEDAMVVIKELGQQYLWVDQFCIDQHDEQDKHAQIRNMDHIYERSHATIVAFSGHDSSCGLPGVSSVRRNTQPRFTSSILTLLSFTPSLTQQSFEASIWMKRGWTFQEALLSRRLLIFTQEQVYFHCSLGWWVESSTPRPRMICGFNRSGFIDVPYPTRQAMQSISPLIRLPSRRSGHQVQVKSGRLLELIQRFTQRQLSFQLDALDAVRGLLSRVDALTYWGIPVHELPQSYRAIFNFHASEVNALFLQCLFWMPLRAATGTEYIGRREGFPTWSWLGWRTPVTFLKFDRDNCYSEIKSGVKVERTSGKLVSLPKLDELSDDEVYRSRVLPEKTT